MKTGRQFLLAAVFAALPLAAHAEDYIPPVVGGNTYTRHLVANAMAQHPEVVSIVATGKRDEDASAVVLGSTLRDVAAFSPAPIHSDDIGAWIRDQYYVVHEPFTSSTGHKIGVLAITFAYAKGAPTASLRATAHAIAEQISRATLSAKNAADPYPYDPAYGPTTYSQMLVNRMTAEHPDLLVMMIHATPPGGDQNIIIGSNIGRFGKAADEDDLRVIEKGETNLEIGGEKDRFETELPLNDASGQRIGALGLVFNYSEGADKEALHRHGLAIRDELARQIPNNSALFASTPLALAGSTALPDYTGDFDHFAIDRKDGRVFLAGEEHNELDVIDLASGSILQRMGGFGAPHSLLYMPNTNELLVVDGEKPSPVLDAATLKVKRRYDLPAGADSIGFDSGTGHLWVVTGGKDVPQADSNLLEIDPATGRTIKSVHFDADHVEAMAVEQHGPRLFINITDKNYLAVVDKVTGTVTARWPIKEAEQNAPIAMDEANHRLFVVTRKPGKLLVLNSDTGATIASFKAPERTDEVTWDPANGRIYVTGGEGYTSVIEQTDPDDYREVAKVETLPGAKTAILDPAQSRLWVAASPGETNAMAKLLWYDIAPK